MDSSCSGTLVALSVLLGKTWGRVQRLSENRKVSSCLAGYSEASFCTCDRRLSSLEGKFGNCQLSSISTLIRA